MKNMLLPCRINSYYLRLKMSEQTFKNISFDLSMILQNIETITNNSSEQVDLALEEYKGQPSLAEYLRRFNIEGGEEDCFSEKIKNKKMNRLDALKLPKIFYEHKAPNIAERVNISQGQLNKIGKESSYHSLEKIEQILSVGQTVVFSLMNFQIFKTIFHEDIIKNWKKMKNISLQSQKSKSQFGQYYYSTQYIQTILFDLFRLPNLDMILWPAVILQPFRGSIKHLKNQRKQFEEGITNEQIQNNSSNLIFENALKDYICSMFMHKNQPQLLQQTENQSISKIIEKINEAQQLQSFSLNLLGTNYCFQTNENILPWLSFSNIELEILIKKTPFKYIITTINQIILNLNEFKQREEAEINSENGIDCLNKLCICNLKGVQSLCIPIRYIFNSQGDRVLVQYFDKNLSFGKNRHYWLTNKDVKVNETLPKHSQQERQLYYLLDSSFSLPEVLSYIYSDYFANKKTFIQALRIIYPSQIIANRYENITKCSACEYSIKNQKALFCTFCLKKYHQQCGSINQKGNQVKYAQNIYLTDKFNQVWVCKECQQCKLCCKKLLNCKSAHKCTICFSKYHRQCGKIIANGKQIQRQKFICELCMKCKCCNTKLRFLQYYQQQGSLFCQQCYSLINSNEVCNKCYKQHKKQQLLSCIYKCQKLIHFSCDKDINNYSRQQMQAIYHCEYCRVQKKKIGMLLVISQLFVFDEDQFFDEPYYEEIEEYNEIIKDSLCLQDIKRNVYANKYNENTSQAILKDLELIAQNAMHFNMPKEDVHFKAKTLLLLSTIFVNSMKHILDAKPKQLMLMSPQNLFKEAKQNFYIDISKNFVKYFLNFGRQDPQIQIIHNIDQTTQLSEDDDIFASFSAKKLLVQSFRNCRLKLKFQDQPMLIRHLFQTPRLTPGVFCKVKQDLCFYHPKQKYAIVFQCQLCWETYCCTKVCYRHIFCKKCKEYGCDCNRKNCQCPLLRPKQYKQIEEQIKPYLQMNQITKLQFTEYHKYCLECAKSKVRDCYICHKLCYYGYQICQKCKKIYHKNCQDQSKQKLTSNQINTKDESLRIHKRSYRLPKTCHRCSNHSQNSILYQQQLQKNIKNMKKKYRRINEYLQIFKLFYEQNQIHLSQKYIVRLIEENYDQFASRIYFFQQYQKSLKQQKHKTINHKSYLSAFDQYHLSPQIILFQVIEQIAIEQKYQIFLKNQQSLKLQSIIKPLMIKQQKGSSMKCEYLFNNNREIEQSNFQKIIRNFLYDPIKNKQIPLTHCHRLIHASLDPIDPSNPLLQRYCEGKQQQDIYMSHLKQFERYLKQGHFFLPQTAKKYIVINPSFNHLYNPDEDIINKPKLYDFTTKSLGIKKLQILTQYLSKFCMKIFEDNKRCLRKGNTIIISSQIYDWKVLKRISGAQFHFRFYRQSTDQNWIFSMNGKQHIINQIQQLISILNQNGIKIYNFDEICHFFGFTLNSSSYEIPKHFSKFMQTEQFYRMNARQIKDRVVHIYNQYQWNDDGTIQNKQTKQLFKMTHEKPYYLNKRKPTTIVQQHINLRETNTQLMTYIDLNRCEWTQERAPEIQPEIIPVPTMQIYVGPSVIDRLGLFASHNIQKYTCIIEYAGEVISEAVADLREKKFKEGCYFFTLGMTNRGKKQIIDASRKGNQARFLNHSCDPNCKAKTIMHNAKPKIIIYTMKNVKKGEQLTYDYQFNIESTGHLACKCGSLLCQGRLN